MFETNDQATVGLHLFDAVPTGENESAPTPQATTGEEESVSAAEKRETREAKREAFRALMEGEYKPFFTEYFQETFNRRFREQRSIKEELLQQREIAAAVALLCGSEKREDMLAFLRTEREKRASTADGYIPTPTHKEEPLPTDRIEDKTNEAEGTPHPAVGEQESETVLSIPQYVGAEAPSAESQDLLGDRTVRTDGNNADDVEARIAAAVEKAGAAVRAETAARLLSHIRARGLRPSENGLTQGGGASSANRAKGLTRDQRAEAARRAARGEYVEL